MGSPSKTSAESRHRWENRTRRARDLQERNPAASEVLRFYSAVLDFQGRVAASFSPSIRPDMPLRAQVDLEFALSKVGTLRQVVADWGPKALADEIRSTDPANSRWRDAFAELLSGNEAELRSSDYFVAHTCLQPIAESLQLQLPSSFSTAQNNCPACSGLPQLSVMRPEGEGASRYLFCSFCLREWLFRRVVCPWCGEEGKEKLPHYSAQECHHLRVDACDTCKMYIKAVDMSVEGLAEPLVDEAAFAALDVWANNQGYRKIRPNLMGF